MSYHSDLDILLRESDLESGQMVIWADALTALQEHCRYLIDRAKHYGEGEKSAKEYIEVMQDIEARVIQIRRTHQGTA